MTATENNGLVQGLSNEAYHADHTHVSKSSLDNLYISPAVFKYRQLNPEPPTLAMEIGSMTHTYILEPNEFEKQYAIQPKFDGRTKEGKIAKERWSADNAGKKPIPEDYLELLSDMKKSIISNKSAYRLLDSGFAEMSVFGMLDGIKCKCRFDWLHGNVAVDLKTTQEADKTNFSKSVANFRYHVQAAFYMDLARATGIDIERFVFIAVEKGKPNQVACYELDSLAIETGRDTYKRQLELLKSCQELDSWPSYGHEIETLSLPAWVTKKEQQ